MKALKTGKDFEKIIKPIASELNAQLDVSCVTHHNGTTDVDIFSPDIQASAGTWKDWRDVVEEKLGADVTVTGGGDFLRTSDPDFVLIANLKVKPADEFKSRMHKLYVALQKHMLAGSIAMWQESARFGYGT